MVTLILNVISLLISHSKSPSDFQSEITVRDGQAGRRLSPVWKRTEEKKDLEAAGEGGTPVCELFLWV